MWLSIRLGALSASNLLTQLFFHWYIISKLGPGTATDALFVGLSVPQLVLLVISSSLMHVLVPLLAGENEEQMRRDAWGFFISIGCTFAVLALVLYLSASLWVPLIAPGLSEETKDLAITLTRIQVGGMVFTALSGVLWAVYHSRRLFLWAEFTPLLGALASLGLLVWALPIYGIVSAAWAMVLRVVIQTVLLLPSLGKYKKPDFRGITFERAWGRIKPLMAGNIIFKTDTMVNNFLVSMTFSGMLSLLYFGKRLYEAAIQIINKAIAVPMVPMLAIEAKAGNWVQFRRIYRKRLTLMLALSTGGYAVLILLGQPLLQIAQQRGIEISNLHQFWWILIALGGLGIGGAAGSILAASFYAKGNTITPIKAGAINYFISIGFKYVGLVKFGVVGIAIGTTINYLLDIIVMYILLEREISREIAGDALPS